MDFQYKFQTINSSLKYQQSKMEQKKTITTIFNFEETCLMFRSYLVKKRFNYVYEEVIKFYHKNQTQFTNHEIIQLANMVFYALKKKIVNRYSPKIKSFNLQTIQQIYKILINIYVGWQNLLTIQMQAQDHQFFNMLYKHKKVRNLKNVLGDSLPIFESKKESIVTQKINKQFNVNIFLKQTLKMAIISLTSMSLTIKQQGKSQLIIMISKFDKIMSQFSQSMFPIQKAEYCLLKYQVSQKINDKQKKINIKYQMPIGLISLILKRFDNYSAEKVMHYIKILFQLVYFGIKNYSIQIKDAYIIANQIRFIIHCLKQKQDHQNQTETTYKQDNYKSFKQQFNDSNKTTQKRQANRYKVNRNTCQKKGQNKLCKVKTKYLSALNLIITQIDNYIESRKQIQIIINVYMQDMYIKYKSNQTYENDEIVDQPSVIKQNSRKRNYTQKNRSLSSQFYNKQNNSSKNPSNKNTSSKTANNQQLFDILKKKTHLQDDSNRINRTNSVLQLQKLKNRTPIAATTFRPKQKKRLLLQITQAQKQEARAYKKPLIPCQFNYPLLLSKVYKKIKPSLPIFFQPINSAIPFLNQSQSDDQTPKKQFQLKRKQTILQVNNKFFNKANFNYNKRINSINNPKWNDTHEQDHQTDKARNDEAVYQEINLLDQVINHKILAYIGIQSMRQTKILYNAFSKQRNTFNKYDKFNRKQDSLSNLPYSTHNQTINYTQNSDKLIRNYNQVYQKNLGLKMQVDQLNNNHKIIHDQLSLKKCLRRMSGRYNSNQSQRDEQQMHYSAVLKDLQYIYNTKNNLFQKAVKHIALNRNLMKLTIPSKRNFINTISKPQTRPSNILPTINQVQQDLYQMMNLYQLRADELNHKKQINNRSIQQSNCGTKNCHKKEIALRDTFDTLRGNISKAQFNQQDNMTKKFMINTI